MCGKPRKFTTLAKRSRQVSSRLSQPARTMKSSPRRDRPHRRLEQGEAARAANDVVARDLGGAPGVGAAGPGQPAEGEPAGREAAEPGRGEAAVAGQSERPSRSPCTPDPRDRRRSGRRRARRRRRAGRCARRSGSARARASAPRRRRRACRGGPGRWRRGASARAGRRSAQFTRQTSTAALSQRPSRMSVSVMVSEVSTPSASWASTARSVPLRISDAAKPNSGS